MNYPQFSSPSSIDLVGDSSCAQVVDAIRTQLQLDALEMCSAAKSGHIGAAMSSLELMMALYLGGVLKFSLDEPRHPFRDRVLVRGHVGPLRYPLFSMFRWVEESEFPTYRRFGSRLQGHETMGSVPGVDLTPSGSLGMLLSFGVGGALAAAKRGEPQRFFVFLGDGEEQEGNVSEAARHAANIGLTNLFCIIDRNKKQLSRPVSDLNSVEDLQNIWQGYGWDVHTLSDGNDLIAARDALRLLVGKPSKPRLLIADTQKGRGISGAEEHYSGYHTIGTASSSVLIDRVSELTKRLSEIGVSRQEMKCAIAAGARAVSNHHGTIPAAFSLETGSLTPAKTTDMDKGQAGLLMELFENAKRANRNAYFLTADVTPEPVVQRLNLRNTTTFVDVGLREQHMIGVAHGISQSDPSALILINTFDAFVYRMLDQLNAAEEGGSSFVVLGDVAGITNSRNGISHQSNLQPFSLIHRDGLRLLEPADIEDLRVCLESAAAGQGITYIRIPRHDPAVRVDSRCAFQPCHTKFFEASDRPALDIVVVTAGLSYAACSQALERSAASGVSGALVHLTEPCRVDANALAQLPRNVPWIFVYNGHSSFLPSLVVPALAEAGFEVPTTFRSVGTTIRTSGTLDELLAANKLTPSHLQSLIKDLHQSRLSGVSNRKRSGPTEAKCLEIAGDGEANLQRIGAA